MPAGSVAIMVIVTGEKHSDEPAAGTSGLSPEVEVLADELLPLFHDELRRIGRRERRRVRAGETLQTTALVNEAYLKLRSARGWSDDRHFLAAAALAMRHALVNHAKAGLADKRGGGALHLSLTQAGELAIDSDEGVLALNAALQQLQLHSPRAAQVVMCRYFAGYSEPETARALGISERTVRREWTLARTWLYRELSTRE